jgi:hypothetical protein
VKQSIRAAQDVRIAHQLGADLGLEKDATQIGPAARIVAESEV